MGRVSGALCALLLVLLLPLFFFPFPFSSFPAMVRDAAPSPGAAQPPGSVDPSPWRVAKPVTAPAARTEEQPSVWPVPPTAGRGRPAINRAWEPPPAPWAPGHRGVDLLTLPGAPVRATAHGRVAFAGRVADRGVVTVLLDGAGRAPLRLTYEPVRAAVTEGTRVAPGDLLGTLQPGPSHCPGPCLHWGALQDGRYLDPLSLLPPRALDRAPSRLLPVTGVPLPGVPGSVSRKAAARPAEGGPDHGLGGAGSGPAADGRVHDALQQRRHEPGAAVPKLREHGSGRLGRARARRLGGKRHQGTVAPAGGR